MAAIIITPDDLQQFKQEIITEIKTLLNQKPAPPPVKKWLKSHEVRRQLTISPGTLQNLRVNGTLPYTKIGGVIYYDSEDIQKMLEENKRVTGRNPFSLEKRSAIK